MRRLFRLTLMTALFAILAFSSGLAAQVFVSGRIAPGDVNVFLKDNVYIIQNDYVVGGTLIIEPGTTVKFYPNSRIIDSTGGRIIADGNANALYNPNPNGIIPIDPIGSPTNQPGFTGYADLRYFLYRAGSTSTLNVNTVRDLTVHPSKYNYVFNVVLDTATRIIRDLNPATTLGTNEVIVPFEDAIVFYAARLNEPNNDININIRPWKRTGDLAADFSARTILFQGQPINNISREWGHIVVMPGARAAFFRNCTFDGFQKDTTVDFQRPNLYANNTPGGDFATINKQIHNAISGSGGAITTFSARTWLVGCTFKNNTTRYNGGALQFLQSPAGFTAVDVSGLGTYPADKNPNMTNKDGSISSVVSSHPMPRIDMIDEAGSLEPLSDADRQAYDDGRLAIYLGRVRNLTMTGNKAQLTNWEIRQVGNPAIPVGMNVTDVAATYPQSVTNTAFGGAIYISGRAGDESKQMEIGLGINNSINTTDGTITFPTPDSFVATGNTANNYQSSMRTFGARGGAIYVGKYTSLIIAGKLDYNQTNAKFIETPAIGPNAGFYSLGGAIFCENTYGRLQVKGGPERDLINNATEFKNNKAASGGAIYVDGNADPSMSPIIGGSDLTVTTRDYGFNIVFSNNTAVAFGGAVYTRRNLSINGAGGVVANSLIGYGGLYPVRFENNTAGYSGGALEINIPNQYPVLPATQRNVSIIRSVFANNTVGANLDDANKSLVRGGGAIYTLNGDLNLVKGVEFTANTVFNGNGGAIAMVHPITSSSRFFITDLDAVQTDANGIATGYTSNNGVFTFKDQSFPADARMLTRFLDNKVVADPAVLASQSGSGTTQIGSGTQTTVASLNGTYFQDANTGFAVGLNGTIIKVTNGGANWAYKESGTTLRLTKVYFTTGSTGYVVGDRGLILKTNNNGETWSQVNAPVSSISLNDVTFTGTSVGYAVGSQGTILKTTDAGNTWFAITGITTNDLNAVSFTGVNNGYIVGNRGTILVTTNAGSTWTTATANTLSNLNCVHFTSASTGYTVGSYGVIYKTTNAGSSWDEMYSDPSKKLNACYFTNQSTGYVAGDFGVMLKTVDAGSTWSALNPGTNLNLNDIFFATDNNGYAVGDFGKIIKTTDAGATWTDVIPTDKAIVDVKRFHPGAGLAENGIGLGGAIYVLDSATVVRTGRTDSINFNRVRIQNNTAYTGAAIYSDNFNLKMIFNRSLITTNTATSEIGKAQNVITGPVTRDNTNKIVANSASSDLASTVIYGEIQGPLPASISPEAANAIYDNNARFLIRLPDAPNSKGILAGTTGLGSGGTDTLRGNYWGRTEANVNVVLAQRPDSAYTGAVQETFFVKGDGATHLPFLFQPNPADPRTQGPFESVGRYSYTPIPLYNGADENTAGAVSIPEQLLMSGIVYDLYDKGTDIKTADYSKRRMSPIEDFAVGIPPTIRRYNEAADTIQPSFNKYVKRWLRDPFVAEARDNAGNLIYPMIAQLQGEFMPDAQGNAYHPIGYPLYLETRVNYEGLAERSNHDPRALNESVFFVINETTGDFIRANLRQVGEDAPYREIFRARVELVPDSTARTPNTLFRRTAEGLANLGSGNALLSNLYQAPYREDSAALGGRKYHAATNMLGKVSNLFSNRPGMPTSNNGNVTYFAGERYSALPVDTGDVVRIISRTVLWKEGVVPAFDDGISFKIVHSTLPPEFTGNIVSLSKDTLVKIQPSQYPWKREAGLMDTIKMTEFLNKVFVSEDRIYPVAPGDYSNPDLMGDAVGRDSILTVTAMDTNRFYDPRSIQLPAIYPELTYTWSVNPNSALSHWLMVDTITVLDKDPSIPNPRDKANGYLIFRGQPINPFVVPGGEDVTVTAENYPPTARTLDSLRSLTPPMGPDTLAKFVNIFTPYFSNEAYDVTNARYLQQDTINNGSNFVNRYTFKIFVTDSLPRFLENYVKTQADTTGNQLVIKKRINRLGEEVNYVTYNPPVYTCGLTSQNKFKANLTDKLRFQADFSTDDEWEDKSVESYWDFRYGRTAYGFVNINIRPADQDTVIIDPTDYDSDGNGVEDNHVISQTRPTWMANQYIFEYGQETKADPYALNFTKDGQLNIRIDGATARNLLKPINQSHGALNLDTVFSVVVTDGHGGKTTRDVPVFINVAPEITTQTLAAAKEDIDYNPQLLDSSKMIKVFDPNFDQDHQFELVYSDYPVNSVPKDPCYSEAGSWDLTGLKTTPKWLKINPVSGLLYGTPGVKDAPKQEKVTVIVWDMIDGERQLSAIKTLDLFVDSTNHLPRLAAAPIVKCIDEGKPYSDTIVVTDPDLLRDNPKETLTLEIVDPANSGLTITPSTITGNGTQDSVKVTISGNPTIDPSLIVNGRVTVRVKVTDAAGNTYIIPYYLKYSSPTDFIATVKVANALGAYQLLEFGTATDATTGEGFNGEAIGTLDQKYCEFELPPVPHQDIFDARWNISKTNGTLRNIFPTGVKGVKDVRYYRAKFQSGGESGNTSPNYPVTISWLRTDIPDISDNAKNPSGASWFIRDDQTNGDIWSYNMRTGVGHSDKSLAEFTTNGDEYSITVRGVNYRGFIILHDWATPVNDQPVAGYETGITKVSPNPVTNGASITFGLVNEGKMKMEVLDVLGNVVATVADGIYTAGMNTIYWSAKDLNGQDLTSGTYTCRMTAGSTVSTYKMVIVK